MYTNSAIATMKKKKKNIFLKPDSANEVLNFRQRITTMVGMRLVNKSKILSINCMLMLLGMIATPFAYKSNKAYYVYNVALLQWRDAESYCAKRNMHLVSIESEGEANFLKNFIRLRYQKMPPYWTGGHKVNGEWHWIASGEKIKDFIWHAGEPNDMNSNEGCIHTWVNEFDWNDDRCNEKLPFICELQT
ncbi:C-type lection lectoxin-Enh3-like isoform 2-T4 [Glossina fuscipes fuscipes]